MARDHSKAQQWANRLERFRHSGLTISQFCRNEQIAIPSFSYWRKRLSLDTPKSAPPTTQSHASFQAIDSVLAWATRKQDAGFQQLIVRD